MALGAYGSGGGQGSGSQRGGSGWSDGFGLGGDEDDSCEHRRNGGGQRHGNKRNAASFLSLREVPLWLVLGHYR